MINSSLPELNIFYLIFQTIKEKSKRRKKKNNITLKREDPGDKITYPVVLGEEIRNVPIRKMLKIMIINIIEKTSTLLYNLSTSFI